MLQPLPSGKIAQSTNPSMINKRSEIMKCHHRYEYLILSVLGVRSGYVLHASNHRTKVRLP